MNLRTRKVMTMHTVLYPRYDIDRLYTLRKEGGRGPTRFQDRVDTAIKRLEDDIKKNNERLLTVSRNNTKTQESNGQQ